MVVVICDDADEDDATAATQGVEVTGFVPFLVDEDEAGVAAVEEDEDDVF